MNNIKIITSQTISQQILKSPKMRAFNIVPYLEELQEKSNEDFKELIEICKSMLSFMNGAEHLKLRKIISKPMSMKSISIYKDQINNIIEKILDNFLKESNPDLVLHFTNPLYISIIEDIFGFKIKDKDVFLKNIELSTTITEPLLSIKSLKKLQKNYLELAEEIHKQIIIEKNSGLLDEISKNMKENIEEKQLIIILMTLVIASRTTTESLVCILCEYNNLDNEIKNKMIDEFWIMHNVDHLVRLCASTKYLTRVANEDISFDDLHLKKDEQIIIDVYKANRDTSFYENNIDFSQLSNKENSHIGFGGGSHICSGLHFAKLVIIATIPRFFNKIKQFKYDKNKITYQFSTFAKRAKSCPITFDN
ncbi:cytochrome P450 [Malaciobacter mytili]|uniref:cytochrome P450 n=1 Tax=Malaciobacter mytili TaxID=603050 RepID=UPI003A83FA9B